MNSETARGERRGAQVAARLVPASSEEFPAQLRELPGMPPALWIRGEVHRDDALAVAVVGARRATPYGLEMAGAARRRARAARRHGGERARPRRRHRCASGRAPRRRSYHRRARLRRRPCVSTGEPEAHRRDGGHGARSSPSFRWARRRCLITSRSATASSRGWRSAWSWSRRRSGAARSRARRPGPPTWAGR